MEFDLFTLLPLAAAVFIFWKLRSVLGTRNGNETPPYNPYEEADTTQDKDNQQDDNVITLPGANRRAGENAANAVEAEIKSIAGDDKSLKQGLMAVLARDPSFEPASFLSGGRMAYEMIVTAFADGDKRSLKNLLSREVYENFASVIDDRASRNEAVKASFVGVDTANIVGAELMDEEAQITVRFTSQMISATVDENDEVVEGDLNEVAEITDVWTFARPVKSRDPNWKLVATDE